jgi:hypothetical protein
VILVTGNAVGVVEAEDVGTLLVSVTEDVMGETVDVFSLDVVATFDVVESVCDVELVGGVTGNVVGETDDVFTLDVLVTHAVVESACDVEVVGGVTGDVVGEADDTFALDVVVTHVVVESELAHVVRLVRITRRHKPSTAVPSCGTMLLMVNAGIFYVLYTIFYELIHEMNTTQCAYM